MIRPCVANDFPAIHSIINEAAQAYRGHIPNDCWHEPYMTDRTLQAEIAAGVTFSGWQQGNELLAVMGAEKVKDGVTLIRHAYTRKQHQGRGIGATLLRFLEQASTGPLLVGTWAGATWAVRFYQRHGFELATPEVAVRLLDAYWRVPPRQREPSISVVLVHGRDQPPGL